MMADIRMLQEQTQQLQQQLQASLEQLARHAEGDQLARGRTGRARRESRLPIRSSPSISSAPTCASSASASTRTRFASPALSQEVEALRLAIPQFPTPAPGRAGRSERAAAGARNRPDRAADACRRRP